MQKIFLSLLGITLSVSIITACNQQTKVAEKTAVEDSVNKKDSSTIDCHAGVPSRFYRVDDTAQKFSIGDKGTEGMVLISGGSFMMGADNSQASKDEYPKHKVTVNTFYLDATEVTNTQFALFVKATGYITTAEIKPKWEDIQKQVPPGTPKPPDDQLVAASLVFKQSAQPVDLNNYTQWWEWTPGADWKHPQGPNSNIQGKGNYPVVQVSWDDAVAYCQWSGKRLPTEAEWEFAARGGLVENIYTWGNEPVDAGLAKCNSWQGQFPYNNTGKDGFQRLAPSKSFKPNGYNLYDMAGNVWEWCSDWYDYNYYVSIKNGATNPKGSYKSYDPDEPYTPKHVVRGGSFLCNDSYCSGYRVSRRMKSSPDTGMEHTGFRCAKDAK